MFRGRWGRGTEALEEKTLWRLAEEGSVYWVTLAARRFGLGVCLSWCGTKFVARVGLELSNCFLKLVGKYRRHVSTCGWQVQDLFLFIFIWIDFHIWEASMKHVCSVDRGLSWRLWWSASYLTLRCQTSVLLMFGELHRVQDVSKSVCTVLL